MALYISEYGGFASGNPQDVLTEPAIQIQVMSGTSTAAQTTSTLSAGTHRVALKTDATAMFFAFGSSTASTANGFTSTNSQRIGAGMEIVRFVSPSARIIASST
jgi:hypothetical protein